VITVKKFLAILLILAFLISGCIGQGADQRPEKVSTLVKEASVMIQEKGEDAFPQIREKGKFYTDDTYVFVWKVEDCKITRVVFPPDLAQEGTDVSDFKDDNNVSITNMFISIANSEKGEGWSGQYLRTNPADNKIEKKVTYIKKVVYKDTTYVIGAGYYIN